MSTSLTTLSCLSILVLIPAPHHRKPLRPSWAFAFPPTPLCADCSVAVKISPHCQRTQPWPVENVAAPRYLQSATCNCPPTSTQKYHGKLHTCTTTTATPVCTQRFLSSRQFQLSIQSHGSRSHYSKIHLIFGLRNQVTHRVHAWYQTNGWDEISFLKNNGSSQKMSIKNAKLPINFKFTGYYNSIEKRFVVARFYLKTVKI